MGLLTRVSQFRVYPPIAFAPGFFGGWRFVPEVGHYVVSMPFALRRRYHGQELLASDSDLTGLAVPSSTPSCRRAPRGYGLHTTVVIGHWWLSL